MQSSRPSWLHSRRKQMLTTRLAVAEQNASLQQAQGTGGGEASSGVFDKKRLYPNELRDNSSFRTWPDRFLFGSFQRAGKQENPQDVLGLTVLQMSYSKAVYGHLRA